MILLFRVEIDADVDPEEGGPLYISLINIIQATLDICYLDTFFSSSAEVDNDNSIDRPIPGPGESYDELHREV